METVVLTAAPRESKGSPEMRRLRREGMVPGNIYGKGMEGTIPVQFVRGEVESLINRVAVQVDATGGNPREEIEFVIKLADAEFKTRLGELQRDVISRDFSHLDFIIKG